MTSPRLILVLLFAISVSIGSILEPWYRNWTGGRNQSGNVLGMLVGDSRKMFADHFFAKADAYFHKGYYPTIFDTPKKEEQSHLTGAHEETTADDHHEGESHHDGDGHHHEDHDDEGFLGKPKDWIDRFSRNFFPSQHSHLDGNGSEREMLPWLQVSADLDPKRVETYVIASYWLRSRLGKVNEAEQFLRQGLRANPDSYEIYYELGRIYDENRHEPVMARNLWEVALRKWNAQSQKAQAENNDAIKPSDLVYEGITGRLAKLEEEQGNTAQAIHYLELLKEKSPVPQEIQKQIDELRAKPGTGK